MFQMLTAFIASRLHREEDGATAVEYGLMVALIAAVIIVAVAAIGGQLNNAFCAVVNAMNDAGIAGTCAP